MKSKIDSLRGQKVLVVGDLMLDSYIFGDVRRISPEAPVPVVKVTKRNNVLGGAANVARNLLGLECEPIVVGIIGKDDNGAKVKELFSRLSIRCAIEETDCATTTKTRIIGSDQQITRVDFEDEDFVLSGETEKNIFANISSFIGECEVVVISDYGKGLCTQSLCKSIIELGNSLGKKIIIDPKGRDWSKYHGATLVTPNTKELGDILSLELQNRDNMVEKYGREVVEKFDLDGLLVTRSEKGMTYINSSIINHFPTQAKEVFDVSGAGDTVVATLAASLAANLSLIDAVNIANKAAGVVVAKIGTAPILFKELQGLFLQVRSSDKIVENENLEQLVSRLKNGDKKIVFTNGCFDILHKGHVVYLEKAKQMGDVLIVGVNSDASVSRLKGPSRPINDEGARCQLLAAIQSVDHVIVFNDDTPYNLIKAIRPNVLVKGGDYKVEDIVGREFADSTATISFVEGYSTTKTIKEVLTIT